MKELHRKDVMAEKFPDWAPQIAIKWYEDSIKCNDDTRNKLREILLSHPNMESVWKTLRRRKSIYGESGETTDYIVFFRRAVHLKLLADSNKPNWEKLTPIKRKKFRHRHRKKVMMLSFNKKGFQ